MHSGGGGTNTASTFALQGLKAAYCGSVGNDYFGELVLNDLKKRAVSLRLVKRNNNKNTALSVVLSPLMADRVILVAPGACHFLTKKEIAWDKAANSRWFYVAPLYEQSDDLFCFLIDFAKSRKIKIALNPSMYQLKNQPEVLKKSLQNIDILLLNLNEAAILAGVSLSVEPKAIAKQIRELSSGIIVITMGKQGACVLAGDDFYWADIFPVQVAERTGAGDGFGSGFVAGLLQKNNLEYAIRLATANSAACLTKVGAKNGLLKKGELDEWPALHIKKNEG